MVLFLSPMSPFVVAVLPVQMGSVQPGWGTGQAGCDPSHCGPEYPRKQIGGVMTKMSLFHWPNPLCPSILLSCPKMSLLKMSLFNVSSHLSFIIYCSSFVIDESQPVNKEYYSSFVVRHSWFVIRHSSLKRVNKRTWNIICHSSFVIDKSEQEN